MGEKDVGRLAGALYLVVVLTGLFSLAYVPGQIVVDGDLQATLANIVASQSLFRAGIASFLLMQVAFLMLPLALYRLFEPVDRPLAALMVVLALVSVPIGLVALTHRFDALSLLTDPAAGRTLTPEQVQAAVHASLMSYRSGVHVTQLFWGLWLLPFGWLVVKSRLLPRILGALLILGCFGYLVQVFGDLLMPGSAGTLLMRIAPLPAAIGEIGSCLWLLLASARVPQRSSRS